MSNTVALSIKLESSYKDRLSHLAVAKKRTSHALAREAIQRFVEQEETHENDRKEAIASYEEYLETGLHITLHGELPMKKICPYATSKTITQSRP